MVKASVIVLAVALTMILAGHRLLPDFGGVTPVVESVLPWLGLAIPALLAAALVRRSRSATVMSLIPAVVWASMFGPAVLRTAPGGPSDLSVVTLNVGAANIQPAQAVQAVTANRDIVALEELTGDAMVEVRRMLGRRYPHHYTVGTVGLWSRYPIREARNVDVGLGWPRALRAVVKAGKADVTVYVMHLASARPGRTHRRNETLATAERVISKDSSRRLLLLGDLNTATTDRHRRGLVPPLTDAHQVAGEGFGFTWPSNFPITRPDHILYRGLNATSAGVKTAPGSDHRAAVAELRL